MSLRRQSIKRQVMAFALISFVGLLLPLGLGLGIHNYHATSTLLSDSLRSTARITAANTSAALAFGDRPAANEILASLSQDPSVIRAVIYDNQSRTFASFGPPTSPAKPKGRDRNETRAEITHDGQHYGHVILTGDITGTLHRTSLTWFAAYALAFAAAGIVALLNARRFHRQVATPISQLAAAAKRITLARNDITNIARSNSHCVEITELADNFDAMLADIAHRDAMLAQQIEALCHEIYERKNVETVLRENQQALLRLSREAGKAEVSVGILHNIGNALNSINVSSVILAGHCVDCRRKAEGMHKLFSLPTEQALTVFDAHPDGHELRTFAADVAADVHREISQGIELIDGLLGGVQHLKHIVASQQTLALTTCVSDFVNLHDAIQDALVLARTTNRHFSPVRQINHGAAVAYFDRSLVVQIILNLLLNAHEAILEQAPADPLISITLGPADTAHLPLAITDNGVGIAAGRLASVFTYGYTTKKNGHGFGLHNAANFIQAQGGVIAAQSPGLGLGATFTLSLPTQSPDGTPPQSIHV